MRHKTHATAANTTVTRAIPTPRPIFVISVISDAASALLAPSFDVGVTVSSLRSVLGGVKYVFDAITFLTTSASHSARLNPYSNVPISNTADLGYNSSYIFAEQSILDHIAHMNSYMTTYNWNQKQEMNCSTGKRIMRAGRSASQQSQDSTRFSLFSMGQCNLHHYAL